MLSRSEGWGKNAERISLCGVDHMSTTDVSEARPNVPHVQVEVGAPVWVCLRHWIDSHRSSQTRIGLRCLPEAWSRDAAPDYVKRAGYQ